MKKILLSLALALGVTGTAQAFDAGSFVTAMRVAATNGLNWHVGDTADYNMKIGFIPATVHTFVREDVGDAFWLQEDMSLLGQAQKVEILIDKNNGQIKKILVNGQEQKAPEGGDYEIVETKEDRVTVPAGTFDVVYFKMRDKKTNQEQEAWVNPKLIPITGAAKSISPSQFGKAVQELSSYKFAR